MLVADALRAAPGVSSSSFCKLFPFSAYGASMGFTAGGRLLKMALAGGRAASVCEGLLGWDRCGPGIRVRRPPPMNDLYRKKVF